MLLPFHRRHTRKNEDVQSRGRPRPVTAGFQLQRALTPLPLSRLTAEHLLPVESQLPSDLHASFEGEDKV